MDDNVFYIAFRRNDNGTVYALRTHRDLAEVAKFKDDDKSPNDDNVENEPDVVTIGSDDSLFRRTMNACIERLSPYHNVIELTSFFRSGLQAANINENILTLVEKRGSKIETIDSIEIFSVPSQYFSKIQNHVDEMKEIDAGMDALPSSILLSLVATYDSIIGEFALDMLRLRPGQIEESSNKTMTLREIFEIADIDKVRERILDSEIDRLLRGSHHDQAVYLENLIDTKIIDKYPRWPNYYEIFERRNRYAHASGIANEEYIRKIAKQKYPIDKISVGKVLRLKTSYLHKSVDIVTEFGILLAFTAWRKFGSSTNDAYECLSRQTFNLICKKRYTLAIWLLDFALNQQSRKGVDELIIRIMIINLANSYKKKSKLEEFEKTLGSIDWSASSIDFLICIAALREDVPKVCTLMDNIKSCQMVNENALRTWPVFDWIKDDIDFRSKFFSIFGDEFQQADLDDEHQPATENDSSDGILH